MSSREHRFATTAGGLRQAFDRSFAEPPAPAKAGLIELLAVEIGGDCYAIRLAEITGLYADRRVVPLPSAVGELLGLVGFRGLMAPVYDLAALLGHTPARSPRWLVLSGQSSPVALAFERFARHVRLSPEGISELDQASLAMQRHIAGTASVGGVPHSIVDLSAVRRAIEQLAAPG
jgi:chemotaxis signal transduction protein